MVGVAVTGESLGGFAIVGKDFFHLFQNVRRFLAVQKCRSGFGADVKRKNAFACFTIHSFDVQERSFRDVVGVAVLGAGDLVHGERLPTAGGPCKNSFAFFEKKKTAHFLLHA